MGREKSKLKRPTNTKKVCRVKAPSTSAAPPPPPPPWIELSRDVTANILQRLNFFDIMESAQKVCTTWRSACQDPAMWRVIVIRNDGYYSEMYNIYAMCRHAVDRSQGQLLDITLEYFGDDELINYICERSSHLKRLFLGCCCYVTSQGLNEAVKKTPQLEELHLNLMTSIFTQEIETIGISCPTLRSFTFTQRMYLYPFSDEEEDNEDPSMEARYRNALALAVAETMPNLRHLSLFGNCMSNVGLKYILDSCPNLESLDIRRCHGVDLFGDLGKRLSQQIKHLRLPSDSTDDYAWDSCGSDDLDFYEDYTNLSGEYPSHNDLWVIEPHEFYDDDHL